MIQFLLTQVLLGNIMLAQVPDRFYREVQQKLAEIGGGDVIDQT